MDASEFPIWTIHPGSGALIKPWITGIIDCYSRVVMNVEMHLAEPNAIDSVAAITTAFLPSGDPAHPFFGQPEVLQTDNASIYVGEVMSGVANRAGIVLDNTPIKCPGANGKIERFFGTFKTQFARKLEGYSRQSHGMQKAKQGGVIPFEVLRHLLKRYLLEYHSSVHSEIGLTPWEAWHEQISDAPGYFIPPAEIRRNMRIEIPCGVTREGVTVLGSNYSGACLTGLVEDSVTVLSSAFGGDQSVDAYHRGKFIGKLRPRELVTTEINTTRTARKVSLSAFRKKVRDSLKKTPPVGAAETVNPVAEKKRITKTKRKTKKKAAPKTRRLGVEKTEGADT